MIYTILDAFNTSIPGMQIKRKKKTFAVAYQKF